MIKYFHICEKYIILFQKNVILLRNISLKSAKNNISDEDTL